MKDWVGWFRQASPYINTHRNRVHVLAIGGEALEHPNFENIVHDLALLSSLGVRLVVVFGARPQIDENLALKGIKSGFHEDLRITTHDMIPSILESYGKLRSELEARLSMGVINSPMHGARISVVSGNFVWAKPLGVVNGVDLAHTGQVRKIESAAIKTCLSNNALVLIPSIGYSLSGDIFNLSYEDLASEVAASLNAEKLIFFGANNGLIGEDGTGCHQLTMQQAMNLCNDTDSATPQETQRQLRASAQACMAGVNRCHLLSYAHDGALLEELFTRDGIGTMVSVDPFDQIRPATAEDINGILDLIQPLEAQGYLVRRSRERLENELDYFVVDVRDNAIIGCAALYPFPEDKAAELSCFAVASAYRREGRGDSLLSIISERAKAQNLEKLFVLTTKTEHWFKERGFEPSSKQALPGNKDYNSDRNAKVLVKQLS